MIKSIYAFAWRNLRQNPLRTLLSGVAISFGVAMIIAADMVSASLLTALLNADVEGAEITHGFVSEQFDVMLSTIGYALVLVAGFLVFNAFAMTVTQRQQQIGALRALGMTRQQVLRLVLIEGGLLAVGGVGSGLILGPLLGYGVIGLLRLIAGAYLAFSNELTISGTAVSTAVALGFAVTLLSIWGPARRASRVPPLVALRPPGIQQKNMQHFQKREAIVTRFGCVLLGIILLFVVIAPPGEWATNPWNSRWTIILLVGWLAGWCLLLSNSTMPSMLRPFRARRPTCSNPG